MIKLYDYFRASSSYRLRIAFALKGIEYETIHIDLLKGEHQTDAYKAINPLGTVPYMIDGEVELNQSLAILSYIDELYPEPPLVYGDAASIAYQKQLATLVSTEMHPFGTPQVWKKYLMGELNASQDQANQWIDHWLSRGLNAYETTLKKAGTSGKFSYGDQITVADICLLPQLYNARRYKIDLTPYPMLQKIESNMLHNDLVKTATPEAHKEAPEGLEKIHG